MNHRPHRVNVIEWGTFRAETDSVLCDESIEAEVRVDCPMA